MTVRDSQLEDANYSEFAWDRYKRLMRWMVLASAISTLVGLGALHLMIGEIPLHMMIATAAGIFFSVLLAAALMGLVFLSAGSGHDDAIHNPFDEEA